ncbi:hypothetical protein HDU98_011863 [Podochytrium sp. JEL0797]|nr:hypothetical protein HDU98_011863 [Podochytrium sp. JEL0797]
MARAVCRNEVLRKKLGIIPVMFPMIARMLATLRDSIVSVYTVDPAACVNGLCGYTSWKSANESTDLTTACFHLIRNLCAAVPENQILACQSGSYKTLDEILTHLGLWLQRNKKNTCPDIKSIANTCVQMGTQCLANMMTSNPIVQNKVWPRFFGESQLLLTLFEANDTKTVKFVLLLIYNCIYNDPQRCSFLVQTPLGRKTLHKIFEQVDTPPTADAHQDHGASPPPDEAHFEIVYAIFKALTTSLPPAHTFKSLCLLNAENKCTNPDATALHLNILNRAHLVFLKFMDGDMGTQSTEATLLWGDMFVATMVKISGVLLKSLERFSEAVAAAARAESGVDAGLEGVGSDLEGMVLLLAYFNRVLGGEEVALEAAATAAKEAGVAVTGVEEAMRKRREMISEHGLVENLVKFLVVAGKIQPPVVGGIGKTNGVSAPKIAEIDERTEALLEVVRKGLFMMKGDSVKVLSSISFRCKVAQDEVRRVGGIPVLLSHCIIDDTNPFIKEWAVFAIRNLCEGNMENQLLIESMEAQGLPEGQNEGLAAHGVRAGLSADGRVRITPVDAE